MNDPAYLSLHRSGELRERAREAERRLRACDLCPRGCRVDRTAGATGAFCGTGARALVHGAFAHFGEERCLVGTGGSGTIFFAGCNLRCVFCQNWEISWHVEGRELSAEELAGTMLDLQRQRCENVNLVSPSHAIAPILAALDVAAARGLRLPLVWNSGGYDAPGALALLDGVVDVYMPDVKYADPGAADRLSHAADYVLAVRAAVKEMHRQVGDLVADERGVARRGLLVRHLVLPNGLAGSAEVLRFLAEEVSPRTFVNVMDQYRPCHRAAGDPDVGRRPTRAEIRGALDEARRRGLRLEPGSERG